MQTSDTREGPIVSLVDIFLKARELERKGNDVIHFDAGEPDFEPPRQVVDATIRAIKEGKARYTESGGIPEAKAAILKRIQSKRGVKLDPNQIVVTAGGRLALYYSLASLAKNSKIGIISPDWPAYRDMSQFLGLETQFFETSLEDGWEIDLEEIKKSDCNAIVLNYPNNPTGKILEASKTKELFELATNRKMTVISDEVYSDYVFSNQFRSVLESSNLHYILVTSLSKSYAMTGYRAAYVVSDSSTASRISKMNSMVMTSAPEFVQYAVAAAMPCEDYVSQKVELIRKRKDAAVRALRDLGAEVYVPDGSLYVFPRIKIASRRFNSETFAMELLEKKFVSVAPGTSFGAPYKEHFRMTLLQNEARILEGIERMEQLIN